MFKLIFFKQFKDSSVFASTYCFLFLKISCHSNFYLLNNKITLLCSLPPFKEISQKRNPVISACIKLVITVGTANQLVKKKKKYVFQVTLLHASSYCTQWEWKFGIDISHSKYNHCNGKLNFIVVIQSLNCVWLFMTWWAATWRTSRSFTPSQRLLKLLSIE